VKRVAVLNVVGLSRSLLDRGLPRLRALAQSGRFATIAPAFPAVTCTAQSNYLTGQLPTKHGVVANGWYHRELAEVQFWKQSNPVVRSPKIWDDLRALVPGFTCANLFWWYNMYSTVDYSITPRPMYPADGRKFFDIYSSPAAIRPEIKQVLGEFPFPAFWGPAAGSNSKQFAPDAVSRWIAQSAEWIERKFQPTLSLVYLPHLDYNLQRLGPSHPEIDKDLQRIDEIVGRLLDFYAQHQVEVVVLSEYGISAVSRPVHLNRVFRAQNWLTIKEELGLELLDCGASKVFAVADHQVAHIYCQDPALIPKVRELVASQPGVERVLLGEEKQALGLDHERSGDLIAVADAQSWFSYYYWMEDARAPDFARCVDIHRKPGYDPVELFLDPAIKFPLLKIASKLLQKKLGFRMLMDVIPLDATLVKGSHGRIPESKAEHPVIITSAQSSLTKQEISSTDVYSLIKNTVLF